MVAIGPSRRSAVLHKFGRDWRLADIGREGREPIWGACSIGVIETFRCELTAATFLVSGCLKKDSGILTNAWVRSESLPQLLRLLDSAAGVSGDGGCRSAGLLGAR
jgi:hypothetical protein